MISAIRKLWSKRWQRFSRRPFPHLVLHFFERFFDSELIGETGEGSLSITAALALLAVPGMLMPLFLFDKYSSLLAYFRRQRRPDVLIACIPDQYLFVSFAMTVTGIVAVLKWDSLFPDRRDFLNLAILPVSLLRILYAKVLALVVLLLVFVLDINGISSITFPAIVTGSGGANPLVLFQGHVLSVFAASFFAFFVVLALIGALMSILPPRWFPKVSRTVRGLALVSLLGGFFTSFAVSSQLVRLKPDSILCLFPPVWFVGLSQSIMGRHAVPALTALGPLAERALLVSLVCAVFAYVISYRRYFVRIPEMLDLPATTPKRSDSILFRLLDRFLLRTPFERACVRFTVKTIFRSERHWLYFGAYAGLGFTFAGQALVSGTAGVRGLHLNSDLLSIPLILCFFVLWGLRFMFDLPAELRANWVFQINEGAGRVTGERIAMTVMLLFAVPIVIATAPVYGFLYGPVLGIAHAGFVLLLVLIFADVLRSGFRKIPFTCANPGGKRNPAAGFAIFLGAFFLFVSVASQIEYWMLRSLTLTVVIAAMITGGWYAWKSLSGDSVPEEDAIVFEDEREPAVRTLNLESWPQPQ
jgi:hypothetical protein